MSDRNDDRVENDPGIATQPGREIHAGRQSSTRSIIWLIFGVTMLILAISAVLWATGDEKARGAAVALVGAAAAHLMKEAQETLRLWRADDHSRHGG